MKKLILFVTLFVTQILIQSNAFAGPNSAGGKITSLLAHGSEPAIRLTGNVSPDNCSGGTYGWLYFAGTEEQRQRVYASALALSLSGKRVAVYTNNDGTTCRIINIQVITGL